MRDYLLMSLSPSAGKSATRRPTAQQACQALACEIQTCLQRWNHQENRCEAEKRAYFECIEAVRGRSTAATQPNRATSACAPGR